MTTGHMITLKRNMYAKGKDTTSTPVSTISVLCIFNVANFHIFEGFSQIFSLFLHDCSSFFTNLISNFLIPTPSSQCFKVILMSHLNFHSLYRKNGQNYFDFSTKIQTARIMYQVRLFERLSHIVMPPRKYLQISIFCVWTEGRSS